MNMEFSYFFRDEEDALKFSIVPLETLIPTNAVMVINNKTTTAIIVFVLSFFLNLLSKLSK